MGPTPPPPALSSDLAITKTHAGAFTAGLDGTYTIGVHNAGPVGLGHGRRGQSTPCRAGRATSAARGRGGAAPPTGRTVTCTLVTSIAEAGDAPASSSRVDVSPGAVGNLTNVAVVEGPNPDPDAGEQPGDRSDHQRPGCPTSPSPRPSPAPCSDRGRRHLRLAVTNSRALGLGGAGDGHRPAARRARPTSRAPRGPRGTWSCAAAGQDRAPAPTAPPIVAATTSSRRHHGGGERRWRATRSSTRRRWRHRGRRRRRRRARSWTGIVSAAAPVPDSGASAGSGALAARSLGAGHRRPGRGGRIAPPSLAPAPARAGGVTVRG